VGDQLSIKVRLVQLTISGGGRNPPLMEVSLYAKMTMAKKTLQRSFCHKAFTL